MDYDYLAGVRESLVALKRRYISPYKTSKINTTQRMAKTRHGSNFFWETTGCRCLLCNDAHEAYLFEFNRIRKILDNAKQDKRNKHWQSIKAGESTIDGVILPEE